MSSAVQAPFRVETRFQLERFRDLPAFLWLALRLVLEFRKAPGAQAMWLKGRIWRLWLGSYSEWADEAAMRRYAGGELHKHGVRRTYASWAGHTWHLYDGARAVHFQKCAACGAGAHGAVPLTVCPECRRPFRISIEQPPARPQRGRPITPRIRPSRRIRALVQGPREAPRCLSCGASNPRNLAYCATCGARTHRAVGIVSTTGWIELSVAVACLVFSLAAVFLYFVLHWR